VAPSDIGEKNRNIGSEIYFRNLYLYSTYDLQKLVDGIVKSSTSMGMGVNVGKTKTLGMVRISSYT